MNSFYPAAESVLASGLSMFSKTSAILLGLISIIFIMRIVSLQLRMAGAHEYGAVIKDLVLYFAMLSLFPILVRLIFSSSSNLAEKISYIPAQEAENKIQEFLTLVFFMNSSLAKLGNAFIINLAQGLYSVFTALLLSIAPIVIFVSTVLGFQQGMSTYFTALISISLWPVVWNLLGLLGKELFTHIDASTLTVVVYWSIIHLLQILSPIFCILLLSSLSPSGIVTGIAKQGLTLGKKL